MPSPPFQRIHPVTLEARLELPLYSTILDATIDFLDVNITNSSVSSTIIIIIPDFRARIKELHIIGKRLLVILETNIDDNSKSELIVKFHCKGQSKRDRSSTDVSPNGNIAEYIEHLVIQELYFFLKTKNHVEMLDEKIFEDLYTSQKGIVIKTPESYIDEIIKGKENIRTEFKPTIDDEYELFETLISFANTEGGLIIVGVNNDGSIRGFVQDESKTEKKLWGLVKSRCEPLIDFTTEWICAHNQPLLLIRVKEGNNKPYNYKGRGIYIREGEHDFRYYLH